MIGKHTGDGFSVVWGVVDVVWVGGELGFAHSPIQATASFSYMPRNLEQPVSKPRHHYEAGGGWVDLCQRSVGVWYVSIHRPSCPHRIPNRRFSTKAAVRWIVVV